MLISLPWLSTGGYKWFTGTAIGKTREHSRTELASEELRGKTGIPHTAACGFVKRDPFVVSSCQGAPWKMGEVKDGALSPWRKPHTPQMNWQLYMQAN